MPINKKSYVPLYAQLLDILIEQMDNGKLKAHDKLPTEKELCERYQVSRTTVRQALDELEKMKRIYKQQGKGSFVAPFENEASKNKVNFINVVEAIKKMGRKPSTIVADFQIRDLIEIDIARALEYKAGKKIYAIKRIRLADRDPVMLEETYLPADRFSGLENEDLESESLHHILQRNYHLVNMSFKREFRAVLLNKEQAKMLKAEKGDPAMQMMTQGLSGGHPFEFTKAIVKGELPLYLLDT
ncbi:GntR family transcriptional regulator [Heyndrickxia coagulans]|uniref:GntR family transcriptional regulator n=1 Tax=Heyndrickxia coagulans TaxID=1398 RepID=UPI000E5006DB|nr:GntR family transcriptional regulator [Heyndrickxia coagulans]RGR82598.1 GntR family transcriptional regulator [Heyndrickxia coagulans]RGR96653.1 GntR family transcriptional regulator [Heyndrickxia coagulans]